MKNYYESLEINKNASKDEIKKAFRKQAHKYHPDKPNGDEAKFKEVNEAYQVLSNDQKRAQYDQFGSAGPGAGFGGQAGGFGGFDPSQFQGGGFDDFDLGDIFGSAFSGGRARARQGQDIMTELVISFEDAIFGGNKKISLMHTSTCSDCGGSGAESGSSMETCPECNGAGQVQARMMGIFSVAQTCPTCEGQKQVPKNKCKKCRGAGVVREEDKIDLTIPGGIKNGDRLRVAGRGEAVRGGASGDLYIKINVKSHKTFTRDGADLRMDYEVKLKDVLVGAKHTIKTLDGGAEILEINSGTQYGEEIKIKGKGVPSKNGDLFVKIIFDIPKLGKKDREKIEAVL